MIGKNAHAAKETEAQDRHHQGLDGKAPSGPAPRDPVCGMAVDPVRAADRAEHDGERYVFCSRGCKAKFEADPALFTGLTAHAVEHCTDAPAPGRLSPESRSNHTGTSAMRQCRKLAA